MVPLYKEVQPTDHFEISLPHFLSTNERQLLTLFYQPLTGPEPISLYLTLWAEGEDLHNNNPMSHYYLMNVLNMSIGKIFEARIALEAIGLLRTWRKDEEDSRRFIYELSRPLDAPAFFQDPLLSMFLFSKIGEQAYRKLRRRFTRTINKDSFKEVSRSFMDVYKPVHMNVPKDISEIAEGKKQDYPFYFEQFDFNLLMSGLSENLIPASSITAEVKEVIAKLAFLYHLSPLDMQKVVILALDDNMQISNDRLKKAAADYYKLTVSKDAPKMEKTFIQSEIQQVPLKASKEQELQIYLETTPPLQVLRDINNGKEPLPSSVELAEDLIVKHGMPIGVVNVLLEYVMLTTDMKLPRKYVERIADHWMRKNLKTAKEAMDLARTERDQYTKWKNENDNKVQNTKSSGTGYKNQSRQSKEIIPEWFYKRNKQEESNLPDIEKQKSTEERRKKILEALGQSDGEVN
ncbi:replication initiation and membrane attachment family protein [Lysinibacillus sp. SGAir0095]|uniref:replication initiation and membrane attachment family protein n=1 Tax=Lysinibacillus sp. SGAir0095 TaxID=2070463 RepID=UPI0010CCDC43|nr:DnaD domain protein [Lysinibacillus sp. SGAir0095]QCR33218.1 helicase DnaB [Lysinibacillus sp. SGAir0095]